MLLSMDRAGDARPRDGFAGTGDALDGLGWMVFKNVVRKVIARNAGNVQSGESEIDSYL